jgi:predicted dehydrogenase
MYMPTLAYEEPLKLELFHFIKSILNDKRPIPSGEEGLRALRICEEALKSAKTHSLKNLRN